MHDRTYVQCQSKLNYFWVQSLTLECIYSFITECSWIFYVYYLTKHNVLADLNFLDVVHR